MNALLGNAQVWIHTPFANALGSALGHFVWEGAAIAALLWVALAVFRGASGRVRYGLACAALVAMPVAFGVTLVVSMPHPAIRVMVPLPLPDISRVELRSGPLPSTHWDFTNLLAWAAPLWMAGVAALLLYRFASWIAAQRLRRLGTCAVPEEWSRRFDALVARLDISRRVALLESCLAEVPMVIGYLRPVVLVPIGMLAGLPLDQVEAILLHELAHIRRADYLVNLLQTMVESLLFYHPAVWWISGVVRAERENCCDDFVLARDTDPRAYAAALVALEQGRCPEYARATALAANGGNLVRRVRRILRVSQTHAGIPTPTGGVSPVALVMLGAGIALAAWQPEIVKPAKPVARPIQQGTINRLPDDAYSRAMVGVQPTINRLDRAMPHLIAQAQQTIPPAATPMTDQQKKAQGEKLRNEPESPYQKWVHEDVAYIISDQESNAFQALTTDEEREQFIKQFWLRRDPTPGTPENEYRDEHYRRIAYVNERFTSASGLPGWKTDRGRIYIMYGPPNEIESHPSGGSYTRPAEQGGGTTSTYPFEKWRYRWIEGMGNNVIIEFVDTARNGEYRMTMDPAQKEALEKTPSPVVPVQGGRGRGERGAPQAAAVPTPTGQPVQAVHGVPSKQSDEIRQQLAILRTKYTDEHPEVQAAIAQLNRALLDESSNLGVPGFHGKHSGVLIYPEGHVTLIIPLEGTGPFLIYGKVVTTSGKPVSYFEEKVPNAAQLNFSRDIVLKPDWYVFTAAMNGAVEKVTFEVK